MQGAAEQSAVDSIGDIRRGFKGSPGRTDSGPGEEVGPAAGALISKMPLSLINVANEVLSELDVPAEVATMLLAKAAIRRGRGGRQKQEDPRLDPKLRANPAKAARILANREAAARSKLKQKLLKEAQKIKRGLAAGELGQADVSAAAGALGAAAAAAAGAASTADDALICLAAVAGFLHDDDGANDEQDTELSTSDDDSKQKPDVTAPKQLTGSQRLPAPAIPPLPDFPSMVRRSSEPLQWANHQLPGQHHPHQHQLNATVELCAHMCAAPIVPQQPLQQSSRFHQESAAAGNTSDNTKRKRSASADGTAAVTVAAPAAASDVQPHRSKRKRHLTAKAVEAAVAGLLPAAAMIPPEVLAEQAATAESPSHRQLQEQQQQQQRPSPSPVPVLNSASSGLVQQTGAQVQQLSSSDPAKVQDALLQLFVLLRHGLYSAGDSGTADAMQVALSGLLQLLERHATISSDLLGITLHVLQTMARAYAACKRYILQCRSHVKLVRLLENATSTQVQLGAALLLDSLVVDGEAATVDAIANAGGVEVLLLLVAGSRQGSQLRRTAASTLCDMAQVSPANEEVATAAVGVARMCN